MTVKDIMTPDPSSCLPSDSVAIAAQIMKRNDVGPVLVVSDHNEKRLIGIVTDRDLALKVIAEGRDPHTTRVDEVMSLNPISMREDEDTHRALQLMANHQIRRIPIVDQDNRLSGIVAQADMALHEDEEEVGRVVEHISEPYGSQGWSDRGMTSARRWSGANPLAAGALCLGIGAGLMYALRPPGRSSRSDVPWDTDDDLVSKIRSRIRRNISRGHGVEVASSNGAITLSGPVLQAEVRELLDCVNAIPGVRSVQSRLEVHDSEQDHPLLRRRRGAVGYPRFFAGLLGGGLLSRGWRSKSRATDRPLTTAGRY